MLDPSVYERNINFWLRAWSGVKTPYTQIPDLPYVPDIPRRLKEHGCKQVLDLGCGSGWLSIYLARDGFEVTGVDVAPQALRLGEMWAQQENLQIKFDEADIASLPYADESFDAVVANSIFEHLTIELAQQTVEKVRTLLRPGGLLYGCYDKVWGGPGEYYELDDGTHVYTDKGRDGMLLRYFTDDELRHLLRKYEILHWETIESGTRVIVAQKPKA